MTCRQCGTEIADKALICFRCGTATSEAQYQPYAPPAGHTRSRTTALVVALTAALVLVAWFLLHSHWP